MKVAIVHYWLVRMRGGEKVVEQLVRMFPQADIYTHVCDRDRISDTISRQRIVETGIARLPGARKHYQKYLPLMPQALEELDLRDYDLVISSESGPAKGVITRPGVPHVCYCHSPMRYIWDMYPDYRSELGWPMRQLFGRIAHRLRIWDQASAARVDHFIANSTYVAERIRKFYRRDAAVIHPPVDLNRFSVGSGSGGHYLFVSELVPYKRADLAIEAFRRIGRPLKIVGAGSELRKLQAGAPANVEFLGRASDDDLRTLYQTCRALIFPAEEDFGIVPLEAMACGRPVIAFGRGGARDSMREGVTGLFFEEQSVDALVRAVERFEAGFEAEVDPQAIAAHAQGFSEAEFRRRIAAFLRDEVGIALEAPSAAG